ncbi:MAG: hypothetical protein OHK0039_31190 [Bacteroidia bacterium]
MLHTEQEEVRPGVMRFRLLDGDTPLRVRDWMQRIQTSDDFAAYFIGLLQASDYAAYFWEVKPVRADTADEVFEFVLVASSLLPGITADDTLFSEHFRDGDDVVAFPNLGGDAQLVVPAPLGPSTAYAHLAAFVRQAPPAQVLHFWQRVGREYQQHLGAATRWLSTAGLGVY